MAKYRKLPVVVDAIKLSRSCSFAPEEWYWDAVRNNTIYHAADGYTYIKTLEGVMRAESGDYIMRGVNGEIYSCKADIFEKTYEKVEQEGK